MAPRLGHGSRHGAAGRTADAPRHEARRLAGRDGPCDLCGPANDYIGSAAPRPRGRQLSWHVCISPRVSGRGRRGAGGTRGHADPTAPDRLAPGAALPGTHNHNTGASRPGTHPQPRQPVGSLLPRGSYRGMLPQSELANCGYRVASSRQQCKKCRAGVLVGDMSCKVAE